jgi:hypothetical protein
VGALAQFSADNPCHPLQMLLLHTITASPTASLQHQLASAWRQDVAPVDTLEMDSTTFKESVTKSL